MMTIKFDCCQDVKNKLEKKVHELTKSSSTRVCDKCKTKSNDGNIIIKFKDENDKLRQEVKSLVSGYKRLVKGDDTFTQMLVGHSSQFEKHGIGYPPMKDSCKRALVPKGPKPKWFA